MTPPPARDGTARRAALLILFLLSGAAALVYEVSWTRRLVLLTGSTSGATALLLAAWMMGLALGARFGGPPADRSRRPLRLYAALETGAALLALALPFLLDGLASLRFLTAAGREPLLFSAAFLCLLLPTTLLGATLPAMARMVTEDAAAAGRRVGMLYAVNTAGAVAGALAAGFVLVEAFGVDGAGRVAVVLTLLIAAAAWTMGGREAGASPDPAEAPPPAPVPPPAVLRTAAAAVFAGGFVGLAAEVLWTRQLVFLLQGFTATFAAMLGAFLLGSAMGGAVFARVAGRTARPLALLGWVQVGVGVAAAGALAILHGQYEVVQVLRGTLQVFDSARANHRVVLFAAAFVVLGPPAFLMGGVFPLAVRAAAGGLDDLGARVGRLYAANTLGAVLGSLAAGFLGVPLLGTGRAAATVALLSIAAGAATLVAASRAEPGGRGPVRALLLAAATGAAILLCVVAHPDDPMILRSGVFLGPRGRENVLVEAREGRAGLASVVRNVRNGYLSLYTDEFLAASTEGRYRYMRMLGHIPMVLAEDPRRVLVMAFGTGTTAGSLSTHPSVERLDVVEISKEVLDVAFHFESVNRGVVAKAGEPGRPEVRLFVEDARRFVLSRPDVYDVITLEPLLPYTPGAVHLYTREFYELCRARLAPGGAMCQWFPVHSMSGEDFRSLAAAFVEVFPETSLWFVEETAALVGTVGPQGLPVKRTAERLAAAGPREDLEAGRLDDLAQWWSFRVCGGKALREWIDRPPAAVAMTDEHPDIEFRPVPTGTLTTFLHDNLVTALDLRERERVEDLLDLSGLEPREAAAFRARVAAASTATEAYMDGRASEDLFGFHASHTRLAASEGVLAMHEREAAEALLTAGRRYADALRANPRDRIVADRWRNVEAVRLLNEGRALLSRGKAEDAEEAYLGAVEADAPWNRDEPWTGVGRARLRQGRNAAAREALEQALAIHPGSRDAQALLGQALVALGRPGEARGWMEKAWEGDSGPSDEDTALRNAREVALRSDPAAAAGTGDAEIRAALREALDGASGSGERRRERAVARLRAATGRERGVLDELLRPHREAARNAGLPAAERVRALALLGAARDAHLAETVLETARTAGGDRALAAAAVDAAAEAGDVIALGTLLDGGNGAPTPARVRAADRLAALRDPRSVDALLDALDDGEEAVRTAAAAALFQLTGRKALDPASVAEARAWWPAARDAWR